MLGYVKASVLRTALSMMVVLVLLGLIVIVEQLANIDGFQMVILFLTSRLSSFHPRLEPLLHHDEPYCRYELIIDLVWAAILER